MIHRGHWARWAIDCRDGVSLGYPKAVPFYTPARRTEEGSSTEYSMTTQDEEIAVLIGEAIQQAANDERIALVEFHGAYPGASADKKLRIANMKRKLNRNRSGCYEVANRGTRFVEGYVTAILANPD